MMSVCAVVLGVQLRLRYREAPADSPMVMLLLSMGLVTVLM